MTHTFFKNNQYQVIKEIDQSPFTVQYAWQFESTQLELVFDPTEEGWDELVENLENGTWTHMVAKVAVLYDGQEIGTEYLGSVVCPNPEQWFEKDENGAVADMVETAMDEARNECVRRLDVLKKDFLGVDITS